MIHVELLTKYYRDVCAVDGVTFDVPRGEVMGLLGPNGAGKTTTLRMLTGFLRPSSGTIAVKDYRIDHDLLNVRKLLGYLPEAAPLYREMLVYDYLVYIARIRSIELARIAERIRELGRLCGLDQAMHRPIGELSKGYKQRVGLAHAMMSDPEILVLDEPTSGLDPNQIVEIREIIREIGREKTVIFSTHILSEAEATCDRIVIINEGRIVADGSAEELKREIGGEKVLRITLEEANDHDVRAALGPLGGISAIVSRPASGNRLHLELTIEGGRDLRAPIYTAVKRHDWILLEFYQQSRSLEDIFRQLTREN